MDLQDWSNIRVPSEEQKYGWLWLFLIEIGVAICIPVFVYGGQMANSLSYKNLVIGMMAGGLIVGVLASLTTIIGQKTRLSTTLLGKITFGEHGNILLVAAVFLSSLGWWGVQTEIMAESFIHIIKNLYDYDFSKPVVILVGGLLMMTTSVLGAKAIGKLSYFAVPALVVLILWPLAIIWGEGSMPDLLNHAPEQTTITTGLLIASMVGAYMTGVVIFPDFGRFLKTAKDGAVASFLTCGISYPLLVLLSAALALAVGDANFVLAMPAFGLGFFALFVIVFATWTSNDCNLYSATLPIAAYTEKLSRPALVMFAGLAGILFASLGIFQYFVPWLVLLGVALAPIAACYIVGYWLNREKYMSDPLVFPRWEKAPLFCWMAGTGIGLMTTPSEAFGFGLITITSAPTIDAFLVAGIFMFVFYGFKNKARLWSRG